MMRRRGPSPVRWEAPALQALVASTSIAALGGMALAAGAAPGLTIMLSSAGLFFCLFPWHRGRLPEVHPPHTDDRRLPGKLCVPTL